MSPFYPFMMKAQENNEIVVPNVVMASQAIAPGAPFAGWSPHATRRTRRMLGVVILSLAAFIHAVHLGVEVREQTDYRPDGTVDTDDVPKYLEYVKILHLLVDEYSCGVRYQLPVEEVEESSAEAG